jgi:hypothetical protein
VKSVLLRTTIHEEPPSHFLVSLGRANGKYGRRSARLGQRRAPTEPVCGGDAVRAKSREAFPKVKLNFATRLCADRIHRRAFALETKIESKSDFSVLGISTVDFDGRR